MKPKKKALRRKRRLAFCQKMAQQHPGAYQQQYEERSAEKQ
jgi:hypothetical protein